MAGFLYTINDTISWRQIRIPAPEFKPKTINPIISQFRNHSNSTIGNGTSVAIRHYVTRWKSGTKRFQTVFEEGESSQVARELSMTSPFACNSDARI
jgi:hypothetical protein